MYGSRIHMAVNNIQFTKIEIQIAIVNDISFQTDLYTTSYIKFPKGDFNE